MEQSTRQKAIEMAMTLLAQKGPNHVTVEEVAAAVGIKPPSLYKHFRNRAELMEILEENLAEDCAARHQAMVRQLEQLRQDLKVLGLISAQRFDEELLAYLEPTVTALSARAYRQLLLQKRCQGPTGAEEYYRKTLLEAVDALERFFEALAGQNIFRKGESRVMAMELASPLSHLVALADVEAMAGRSLDPIWDAVRRHLKQFHRVYAVREKAEKPPVPAPSAVGLGGLTGGGKRLFRGNR